MAKSWDEDEEDLTVVEEKKGESLLSPDAEDETVAFVKKSSLGATTSRRKALEAGFSNFDDPSPFNQERFPLHAALPRDRFAAFFIDTFLLTYGGLGLEMLLNQSILKQNWFLAFSSRFPMAPSLCFWLLFLLWMLLYYVSFEAIGGASPGKYFCRLRVVDLDGSMPTLANVFLRNLCRLFDYPLFFSVAILSMESSHFYQRLGDRAARTIVVKNPRKKTSNVDLRSITLSSTFVRALACGIDLVLYFAFLWFYAASLNPQKGFRFQILLFLFPFLSIAYFMIFEFLTSSTPGKIILKRQSILETGEPLDGSAAILRNLARPLDVILGYPLLALSRKKQRLGDFLAETLVIKKQAGREGAISLICLIVAILSFAVLSNNNPQKKWFYSQLPSLSSWMETPALSSSSFNSTRAPQATVNTSSITKARNGAKPQSTSSSLRITEFYFSAGADPTQIRSDGLFHAGDLIFAFFKLAGFQRGSAGKVDLIEDIQIEAPNGELLVDKSDVIHFSQNVGESVQSILFADQLLLPPNPVTGTYKVFFILRDLNSQTQLVYEKNFVIQ